jgi:hypothetical protein
MSTGFKVLNELEAENKLTLADCNMMKTRFYKLHKIMSDNQAKET